MIIRDIHIYRFSLPLHRPLTVPGRRFNAREGFIFSMESDDNRGIGETSPFPGLSRETTSEALEQLLAVSAALKGRDISTVEEIDALFPVSCMFPSVRFGVESALLDLTATSKKQSIGELLQQKPAARVKVNALITGALQELPALAAKRARQGYSVVKIKVGRKAVDDEIEMVQRIRQLLGPDIAIRLDANRAWNFENARYFLRGIGNCNIEYIEEPLARPEQLTALYEETRAPLALDESLSAGPIAPPRGTAAFILKPGVIGGVGDVVRFIEQAQESDIKPVLSSAFLSAVGLNVAAQMAAALIDPRIAMGFDTLTFFKRDLLGHPVRIHGGSLDVAQWSMAVALPPALVREVAK